MIYLFKTYGKRKCLYEKGLFKRIETILKKLSCNERLSMSKGNKRTVDGRGVIRIIEEIIRFLK